MRNFIIINLDVLSQEIKSQSIFCRIKVWEQFFSTKFYYTLLKKDWHIFWGFTINKNTTSHFSPIQSQFYLYSFVIIVCLQDKKWQLSYYFFLARHLPELFGHTYICHSRFIFRSEFLLGKTIPGMVFLNKLQ